MAARPGAIAVVCERQSLTYAELDARSGRLAAILRAAGVGPERLVGLALPRSLDLIVAQVAVLRAGGAYLPIDVDHPTDRIGFTLADARPLTVVTTRRWAEQLPDVDVPMLALDDPAVVARLSAAGDEPLVPAELLPTNTAYVIYTSGSTGRPKGVVLTHAGVAKLVATQTERFGIGPDSRVIQFASPSFDVSFWDLCIALLSGGRLIVVPAERRVAGPELTSYIAEHGGTFMILPPALLAALPAGCDLPEGATLLAGTERVSPALVARYATRQRMFNAYGPTEATVNSTLGLCDSGGAGRRVRGADRHPRPGHPHLRAGRGAPAGRAGRARRAVPRR